MAPHQVKPHHVSEEQSKYPPEAKHGENSVADPQTSGIVEFLHFMGLQLKRSRLDTESSENFTATGRISVPSDVELRECAVVIIGSTCDICGKSFKCITDVKVHKFWRHRSHRNAEKRRKSRARRRTCKECGAQFKTLATMESHWRIAHGENRRTKFRVILRIGEEVVAERLLKRRHYRLCSVEAAAQTELKDIASAAGKDTNNVSIDSVLGSNNVRTCGRRTACTVDTANQYFNDDFPPAERVTHDESYLQTENQIEESLKASDLAILLSLYRKSAAPERIDFSNITSSTLQPEDSPGSNHQENLTAADSQIVTKEQSGASTEISRSETPDAALKERGVIEDDDVQEVLRINRGRKGKDEMEINHESPNRSEREMLLSDAIKQMIRMEQAVQRSIYQRRKRKAQRILKERNNNDIFVDPDNSTKNAMQFLNTTKELNASENRTFPVVTLDAVAAPIPATDLAINAKVPAANFNVSLEELNQYGINYYNEVIEVNNNLEK